LEQIKGSFLTSPCGLSYEEEQEVKVI